MGLRTALADLDGKTVGDHYAGFGLRRMRGDIEDLRRHSVSGRAEYDPRRSVASVEKQAIDGTEIILVEEAPVERDRWRIGA